MECGDQTVQLVTQPLKVARRTVPFIDGRYLALVPGGLQLPQDLGLLRFGRVNLEAIVAEPDVAQPPLDHFEGSRLLRDEKNRSLMGEALGDDVGDSLAFARAGRAKEHEILAGLRCENRRELGRVGR